MLSNIKPLVCNKEVVYRANVARIRIKISCYDGGCGGLGGTFMNNSPNELIGALGLAFRVVSASKAINYEEEPNISPTNVDGIDAKAP